MDRSSKRMKESRKSVDPEKVYSLQEALATMSQFKSAKFDETVELHFHLSTDPKETDQSVRGTVVLPHGLGKKIRVAVFCKGEAESKAKAIGADYVGSTELIEKVANGFLDFDVVVATPDMMRDLSKLGKVLGPRGLMPTPKAGTVTTDIEKAISEAKAGKIEFKSDKQAGIHVGVGKRSFSSDKILENAMTVINAINQAKPTAVKGNLIKSLSLTTTMGPGIRVTV